MVSVRSRTVGIVESVRVGVLPTGVALASRLLAGLLCKPHMSLLPSSDLAHPRLPKSGWEG